MSITDMRGADLRGYHTADSEEAGTSKSKLLAASAVVLGVIAIGAYAYTSHNLLPSTPVKQQAATVSQPVALTPPAVPASSQPDLAAPAPQAAPAPDAQAAAPQINTAPDIKEAAPQSSAKVERTKKAEPAKRVAHVKSKASSSDQSTQAVTPPDPTQVPATPSQTVSSSVSAPANTDTTTSTSPYVAAPSTTPQSTVTPQTVAPDYSTSSAPQRPQIQQPTTPDQSAPQTQPQQ